MASAISEHLQHLAQHKPSAAPAHPEPRLQDWHAPEVLVGYDITLRCVHIGDAFSRHAFGRQPAEIVGHMLCDIAPTIARTLEPLLRHVLETDQPLLGVAFDSENKQPAPKQSRQWLGDVYPLHNAVGNTVGVGVLSSTARPGSAENRRAKRRLAMLADASRILTSALDVETILRRVAQLAVSALGEWCAIHIVEDRTIRLIAHATTGGPGAVKSCTHCSEDLVDALEPPPAVAHVLGTGGSLRLRGADRRSCLIVPMKVDDRTLGTLSFGPGRAGRYRAEDVAVAEDLARLCARSVHNAELPAQSDRRLRELDALQRADAALYQSLDLDEVLQALIEVAADMLQADKSVVVTWDAQHRRLVPGAARGFAPDAIPRFVFAPGEGITGRAAANGQPIAVYDLYSDPRVPPHMLPVAKSESIHTLVAVPIKLSGEIVGVFDVAFRARRILSADDQRLLLALAERAALAIRNARLYAQAQDAIHAREEVLAATSHELRNPLGNIKGFVTTLQRTDVDWGESIRRDFLGEIERETDRIQELSDDLLDIARMDGESSPDVPRELVTLNALVDRGVDRVRHVSAGREIVRSIDDDLPAVEVNQHRLEQVVANLVQNAAKYSPAGTPIHLIGRLQGSDVELAVEDEGPGIPPEHLERIFDSFFRASAHGDVPGTGLGLALCRAIVNAEGGSIWAENRASGGARFVVRLPLNKRRS
jgi:K+-sensing histidine kinase KdpD